MTSQQTHIIAKKTMIKSKYSNNTKFFLRNVKNDEIHEKTAILNRYLRNKDMFIINDKFEIHDNFSNNN